MPAEWEPHTATWLTWPKNIETFPESEQEDNPYLEKISHLGKKQKTTILKHVQGVYLKAIPEIAKGEKVHLLVDDE